MLILQVSFRSTLLTKELRTKALRSEATIILECPVLRNDARYELHDYGSHGLGDKLPSLSSLFLFSRRSQNQKAEPLKVTKLLSRTKSAFEIGSSLPTSHVS